MTVCVKLDKICCLHLTLSQVMKIMMIWKMTLLRLAAASLATEAQGAVAEWLTADANEPGY